MHRTFENEIMEDHRKVLKEEVATLSYIHSKELLEHQNTEAEVPIRQVPENLLAN